MPKALKSFSFLLIWIVVFTSSPLEAGCLAALSGWANTVYNSIPRRRKKLTEVKAEVPHQEPIGFVTAEQSRAHFAALEKQKRAEEEAAIPKGKFLGAYQAKNILLAPANTESKSYNERLDRYRLPISEKDLQENAHFKLTSRKDLSVDGYLFELGNYIIAPQHLEKNVESSQGPYDMRVRKMSEHNGTFNYEITVGKKKISPVKENDKLFYLQAVDPSKPDSLVGRIDLREFEKPDPQSPVIDAHLTKGDGYLSKAYLNMGPLPEGRKMVDGLLITDFSGKEHYIPDLYNQGGILASIPNGALHTGRESMYQSYPTFATHPYYGEYGGNSLALKNLFFHF